MYAPPCEPLTMYSPKRTIFTFGCQALALLMALAIGVVSMVNMGLGLLCGGVWPEVILLHAERIASAFLPCAEIIC